MRNRGRSPGVVDHGRWVPGRVTPSIVTPTNVTRLDQVQSSRSKSYMCTHLKSLKERLGVKGQNFYLNYEVYFESCHGPFICTGYL